MMFMHSAIARLLTYYLTYCTCTTQPGAQTQGAQATPPSEPAKQHPPPPSRNPDSKSFSSGNKKKGKSIKRKSKEDPSTSERRSTPTSDGAVASTSSEGKQSELYKIYNWFTHLLR